MSGILACDRPGCPACELFVVPELAAMRRCVGRLYPMLRSSEPTLDEKFQLMGALHQSAERVRALRRPR